MKRLVVGILGVICLVGPAFATDWDIAPGDAPCRPYTYLHSDALPTEHGRNVLACIRDGDFEVAIASFAIMSLKLEYDGERLPHAINSDVVQGMRKAVERAGEEIADADRLKAASEAFMGDARKMRILCQHLYSLGPPSYWPEYVEGIGPAPVHVTLVFGGWRHIVDQEPGCGG